MATDKYDKLDDSANLQTMEDNEGLLLDDLGKKKAERGSEDQSPTSPAEGSPLRKPKKVLEVGKAVLQDQSRGLRIIVICAFVFSFIITVALILSIYLGPPQIGANAAVATDVGECSTMGLDILKQGGNAVDAAIAAMFCVGVVNAQSSGIGGGGFMIVHDHKNQKSEVFDFRETAPASSTPDMFGGDEKKRTLGGLAVAVPGELRGMEAAHGKHGKLAWKAVVTPAAELARNGFRMTGHAASILRDPWKMDIDSFMKSPLSRYYTQSDGKTLLKAGDTIKRPDLASTLTYIAENGADAVYDGKFSDNIIKAVVNSDTPGHMTRADLRDYKVEMRDTVATTYHDYTVESVPAPGSGPVLLAVMNVLEGLSLKRDGASFHKILQAVKFGFAERELLGDPSGQPSVDNATSVMMSKEEAIRIRNKTANVNESMDPSFFGTIVGLPNDQGTSHISVIDPAEIMVSVTTSVNTRFGSMVMTDDGILLNNQMADFSLPGEGGSKNQISPDRRPLSSMSPVIVYKTGHTCGLRMALGGANGTRIITGLLETLLNNLTFGMELDEAVRSPRLHTQLDPPGVEVEAGFPVQIVQDLKSRGYTITNATGGLSEVQAVLKIKDRIQAISDHRKSGAAAKLFQ